MPDKRPDTYCEAGRRVWRASSLGACDGYLVRVATGQTPAARPEFMENAMQVSAGHEAPILAALANYGWDLATPDILRECGELDHTGQIAGEMSVPGGVVRCHPDHIAVRQSDGLRAVVEAKAMREGAGDVLGKSEFYRWQVSVESAVTRGLPVLFVVGWKDADTGELLLKPDGTPNLTVALLEGDAIPYSRSEIRMRVARLNKLIDAADDGGGLPDCTWKMYPCGFWPDHDKTKGVWMETFVEVPNRAKGKLRRLGKKLAEVQAGIKAEQEQESQMKAELLTLMTDCDVVGKVDAGQGVVVERVVKKGRVSFDKKAAVADGVDVAKYETVGKGSDYVTVKVEE